MMPEPKSTGPLYPYLTMICIFLQLIGCSGDSSLSGSLSEVYKLNYDTVRARLYRSALSNGKYAYSELAIEYVSTGSGAVPVRITLRTNEVEMKKGKTYKLGKHGDISGQLADGSEIPRFKSGHLTLDNYPKNPDSGKSLSGSFDAKFRAGRDTLSLSGDFVADLEVYTTVR